MLPLSSTLGRQQTAARALMCVFSLKAANGASQAALTNDKPEKNQANSLNSKPKENG